LTENAVKAF
jgi:predicted Zn-dependent protease